MAPHVADTLVSGLFDIVVHESGGATGNHSAVLLTERTLKPGSYDGYMDAGRQMNEDMGGMPAGLEFMLLQDTANRDHVIQLGIVRVADIEAFRDSVMPGRQNMLDTDRAVRRVGRAGRRLRADRGGRSGPRLNHGRYPLARCRKLPIATLRSSWCA